MIRKITRYLLSLNRSWLWSGLLIFANLSLAQPKTESSSQIANYNVVWDSPSNHYNGSMPAGNGDIAVNAWVEASGDLLFYIGKTDTWDEYGRLLKLGRVRIQLAPPALIAETQFRQTLSLPDGTIYIDYGTGERAVQLHLWVDANYPVIQVEISSQKEISAIASIEIWRTRPDTLASIEVSDVLLDRAQKNQQHALTIVQPDQILAGQSDRIGWYHHNAWSVGPDLCAQMQGVSGFPRPDPLLQRTFGAVITAEQPQKLDDRRLQSKAGKFHSFAIYVQTRQPVTPQAWLQSIEQVIGHTQSIAVPERRKAHVNWWQEFWQRSWIYVEPAAENDIMTGYDAFVVSRAYALQRFINACAGRGQFPIKFNGSLFTVPAPEASGDADYRRWGPGYWWQNTRLPYISMCASGDFDLMQPLFRMYGQDLMPLARHRTQLYFNHDGAFIPECIYFWGDVFSETYGWTPFEQRSDKLQESGYHKWEWVSGPELVFMMLDYYDYTQDVEFLHTQVLPTAQQIFTFFDQHYQTDEKGKLVMHPAQALETWWDCTNPMPELAGLQAITARLLALAAPLVTPEQRNFWTSLKNKLPKLPIRKLDGIAMLAPAERFADKRNIENPELYAVFPFRLFARGKPDIALALKALKHRTDLGNFGWRQDDIFMAYLGLADSAQAYLIGRAKNKHAESRFPAFWGPNYDWIPDQDHGGILLKTLQTMLLQAEGRTIYLLPAWPLNWNASFKLHAPYRTIVSGTVRNGKIIGLEVLPANRRKDVVILPAQ